MSQLRRGGFREKWIPGKQVRVAVISYVTTGFAWILRRLARRDGSHCGIDYTENEA